VICRSFPEQHGKIFLTFDDGPCALGTPAVLDVLQRMGVPATFFVVGDKLAENSALVRRMQREGHAFGNHSCDHRYGHFFSRGPALKEWILTGERDLLNAGLQSVGFRPPAGILTPPVRQAARELKIPLVLWNKRFFDTVLPWTAARARRSGGNIAGGSIVLLHDRQRAGRLPHFCRALEIFIRAVRERGLEFSALDQQGN
jgi:peptidoglycan-N-acetylglucosamine deacetylase